MVYRYETADRKTDPSMGDNPRPLIADATEMGGPHTLV